MITFYRSLFLTPRFFYAVGAVITAYFIGQFIGFIYQLANLLLVAFAFIVVIDGILLFFNLKKSSFIVNRKIAPRLSNGDENEVVITIQSNAPYSVESELIDELPIQFQKRDFSFKKKLTPTENWRIDYSLYPTERGEYQFGRLLLFVKSPLGILMRKYKFDAQQTVKVYPSFLQMRKFEMMAISNRLTDIGIKKVRKIGHQMEFDQIKDYMLGDDVRAINWKATARKGHLMVNQFQDEKSQQIINILDMGRTMKMPFNGMSLLDYAINASLVLSNIAMQKQDKAGLIAYNSKIQSIIAPSRSGNQMQTIMDNLYNLSTDFEEHNHELLFTTIRRNFRHRSLLVLYTNFESLESAQSQIPFLQRLAKDHVLLIVFFENSEVKELSLQPTPTLDQIYIKTIAEKFIYDKRLIVKEFEKRGIYSILTEPGMLTVNTINKYLEFKSRGII